MTPTKTLPSNGIPAPKQQRSKATIGQVLEVTSRTLAEHGEGRVRVQEISAETGVSIGSIYHHFGNREGLILAAYVDSYAKGMRQDLEVLVQMLDGITQISQMIDSTDQLRALMNSHFSEHSAMARVAILGGSAGRQSLKDALTREQTRLLERFAESIERLKQLKILKQNISSHAIAVVVVGLVLGRAVSEVDGNPLDHEEWNQVVLEMLFGLLNPELLPAG